MANPLYQLVGGMIPCTPNDNTDINPAYSQGVWTEADGNIAIMYKDGTTHVFGNWPKHRELTGHIKRVLSTGITVSSGNVYTYSLGIGKETNG